MTTIVEAHDIIADYFIDQWGDTTPIALQNQVFEPTGDEFVRIAVIPGAGEYAAIGGGGFGDRLIRQYSIVIVQVFTNRHTGLRRSNELCQQAFNVLKNLNDDVELMNGRFKDVGDQDDSYYQRQVLFDYNHDLIG